MLQQLKKHFPSLQSYKKTPTEIDDKLTWFIAENGQIISIDPSEITEKDSALLHIFLKPYQHNFPPMTKAEKLWQQYIQADGELPETENMFRLIFFQIPPDQLQPADFKDALNQLFEKEMIILWESETEGVIVDKELTDYEEDISLEEIIDILMSDLYIKIRFFVSPYLTELRQAKHYYNQLTSQASIVFSYSEHNVISYIEAIPYLLIDQLTPKLRDDLQQLIPQEFQHDKGFLKMMEVFLKSNLNVSVAAKKLYMHRNSFQYRIEKFKEKTGLDIRNFHHALTVYLALLVK